MPSPFPGMDPYLEGSEWMSVDTELAVQIARQLTPQLVPRYVARPEKRYVVTTPEPDDDITISSIYPDASVAEESGRLPQPAAMLAASTAAPLTVATLMPERIGHVSVEIRDTSERRLVTAIEILSPTNKRGEGRTEYLERRHRLLLSAAHLIEIDLLRGGQRIPMQRRLPLTPYFVFVGKADRRPLTEVWPISFRESLPTIPVPLLPGDADVPLDLQQALTAVYDDFGYAASVNYNRPPEVRLAADDVAWAEERIAAWRELHR